MQKTKANWKINTKWQMLITIVISSSILCYFIYSSHIASVPIRGDGFGYFSYLSSVFIDNDLSFRTALLNVPDGVNPQWAYGLGKHPETGKMFVKYTPGVAILAAPFYVLADALTWLFKLPRSGYSIIYQFSAVIAGIFYLLIGLKAIFEVALFRFNLFTAMLTSVLILLATNVLHYGVYDQTMAHIYSFGLIALYVRELILYKSNLHTTSLLPIIKFGVLMGLIILTRVPDAIIGLLAAFLIILKQWASSWLKTIAYLSIYVIVVLILLSPLFLFWYYSTGSFLINSYSVLIYGGVREGFNWTNPQVINFLFSAKAGYFFWAPVTLFAFLSLPLMIKQDKALGWLLMLVLTVEIYIYSSWWLWDYGASIGSRPMVDMMPLIALPLATLIDYVKVKTGRLITITLSTLFIGINLLFIFSSWSGIIPIGGATSDIFLTLPNHIRSNYVIQPNQANQIQLTVNAHEIPNRRLQVMVSIQNNASTRFESFSHKGPIRISWRFINQLGNSKDMPGWDSRVNTHFSLSSGQRKLETFEINLPNEPGSYLLQVTLVQEGVSWFHDLGMIIGETVVNVKSRL